MIESVKLAPTLTTLVSTLAPDPRPLITGDRHQPTQHHHPLNLSTLNIVLFNTGAVRHSSMKTDKNMFVISVGEWMVGEKEENI